MSLESNAPPADVVRLAVKDGIQDALADPETWVAVRRAFMDYAKTEAGGFTLGFIGAFFRRLLFVAVVVGALLWIGGPSAVIAWLKSGAQ